ncbi:MAG: MFS transporter, partial [Chloroflexi bacterium]|nr:MFS transporter [Chloroflexota bacterium]
MVSRTVYSARLAGHAANPWLVGVICGMASYIDAATIFSNGIALVIYQHSIGVTSDEIGVMSGALIFCTAIGALFGGRLGDRFGRRRVFLVTMILIMLGSALLTFSTAYSELLGGVILVGVATGADLPVSLAAIAEAASDKNRGAIIVLSNILWIAGIISAIAISAIVGGWGRLGGQVLYAQLGAVALVVLLLRFTIPESELWLESRDERRRGIETIRADKASFRDFRSAPYLQPFLALLAFYALTNL